MIHSHPPKPFCVSSQCSASFLETYLSLLCFVVQELDLQTFLICQLAQYYVLLVKSTEGAV